MLCKNCGKEIPLNSEFCAYCRAPIGIPKDTIKDKDLYLRALEMVPESERRIFLCRRGKPGGYGHTAEITARRFGLTPTEVLKIVTKVEHKLHKAITSEGGTSVESGYPLIESSEDLYPRILGMLSDQKRRILVYRRGLEGGRVHTMAETVSFFSVTPAYIDEIKAEAHQIYLYLISMEATMNLENSPSNSSIIKSYKPMDSSDNLEQSGGDIPDEELLTLVRNLIEDDEDVKKKILQCRTLQQNAPYIESIGVRMLNVSELQALRGEWPQYADVPGSSRKKLLANRIAAIERTAFFDSLLEWLATRLWDVSTQLPLSAPSMEETKTGILNTSLGEPKKKTRLTGEEVSDGELPIFDISVKPEEKELPKNSISLTPEDSSTDYHGKTPIFFILDGKKTFVNSWIEFLLNIFSFLYSKYPQNFEQKTRYIVEEKKGEKATVCFSKNKDELQFPRRIKDTDIYVETKFGANAIVKICKTLLNLCGEKQSLCIGIKQ